MNDYLNTKELAERWKMSPQTLATWRNKGIGPRFIKLGGVRYPMPEVLTYEERKQREANQALERRAAARPA